MSDLTTYAHEGFNAGKGTDCPHFASSPAGMAWLAGHWLATQGQPLPKKVTASRGYTVRADGRLIDVDNPKCIAFKN